MDAKTCCLLSWLLLNSIPLLAHGQSTPGPSLSTPSSPGEDLMTVNATFNMRGVRGYVTFTESPLNKTVIVNGEDVAGVGSTAVSVDYKLENSQWIPSSGTTVKDELFLTIHEFPVLATFPGDRCSDEALGKQLHGRSFQIGPLRLNGTLTGRLENVAIPLYGHKSILGRSLLAITTKNKRFCATLTPSNPLNVRTAVAKMRGNIAGDIYFRQFPASEIHTAIYVDLYKLIPDGMAKNVTYKWLLMTTGPLDRERPEDEISCRNMRILFDPDFRDESKCSPDAPNNCKIGNMVGKFGGLPVGLVNTPQRGFFTDTDFTLSGWSAGRGIYVAIFHPLNDLVSISCGEIRPLATKLTQAAFSNDGVTGVIKFRQSSPFDPTEVYVNLKGLGGRGTTIQLHQFPRRQRILPKEDLCSKIQIGDVYNPASIPKPSKFSANVTGFKTHDQYALGDLSGKYGDLSGLDSLEKEFFDDSLPLFGTNSIVGRPVNIGGTNTSRWICSNNWPEGEGIMAQVRLFYTVGGTIYLRQSADDWRGDTQIWGDLYYTNGVPQEFSSNHNWRVHSGIVMRDAFSFDERCKNALDVFNPLNMDTRKDYTAECVPHRPVRCRLGDLGAKLRLLTVALKSSDGNGKFMFTDTFLPLSGPMSVVGKSIVIYSKEMGDDRFACGNIERVYPVKATAKKWASTGKIKGSLTVVQPSIFQETEINVGLEDLDRAATSLWVHKAPVEYNLVIPCTEESLGDLFNPFNLTVNDPIRQNKSSDDGFPVGDLSGKYGSLAGMLSYARLAFDENLPVMGKHSIVGRSIGLGQSGETRSYGCADIMHDIEGQEKTKVVYAVAEFPGPFLWGYMRMFQVVYKDGSTSPLTIQARLAHMVNDSIEYMHVSKGHRWSVNQLPVATDASIIYEDFRCITAGLTDNYFNSITDSEEYRQECWAGNPTRCAYGDVMPRLGPLTIAFDERQVFTDDILKLKGNVSLIGRSIVIFDRREGDDKEIRLACANIVEEEQAKTTVALLHTGTFDSVGFETYVAKVTNLSTWNVWIDRDKIHRIYHDSCVLVEVNIRAPRAEKIMRTFTNYIDLDQFKYLGYESCDKRKNSLKQSLAIQAAGKQQNSAVKVDDDDSAGRRLVPSMTLFVLSKILLLFFCTFRSSSASQFEFWLRGL